MQELPLDGGILLKWGAATAQPKVREFHLERNSGETTLVYKTRKLLAKSADTPMELKNNFFVKRVRNASEQESAYVVASAKAHTTYSMIQAKRCFDIDFFDPNFPPAVGPTKIKSVSLFATPDTSLGDLWSYMSNLMVEQGIFIPNAGDPDHFTVVKVVKQASVGAPIERRESTSAEQSLVGDPEPAVVATVTADPPKTRIGSAKMSLTSVDAEILLNALPLPPASDFVNISLSDESDSN